MDKVLIAIYFVAPMVLAGSFSNSGVWTHSWNTALSAQFIDFGYQPLSEAQATFIANHYGIVSLEKCTGNPTEVTVWATAKQLKAINPKLKVLFYWDLDQTALNCYDAYHEYMNHSEWWLRDDRGVVVYNAGKIPMMDYTVAAARDWWVNVPLNGTGAPMAPWIDGVLADGTGGTCPASGINAQRCQNLEEAKSLMVSTLQGLFDSTNNGSVIENGLNFYDSHHNMHTLKDSNGIMAEHFAAFEALYPNSGKLNSSQVAKFIELVGTAANAGKMVVVATWVGQYVKPMVWFGNTQPTTNDGWREAMLQKHTFALAGFLTMAAPNVWMQYEGWYGIAQGACPCPEAPETCMAPTEADWYPDLYKPLGNPLGPAVRAGNVWTRFFEHAKSVLNIDDPDASTVTFF